MKKILISIIGVLAVGLTTGCEEHLEVQNSTKLTLDNYFTSYEEGRMATAPLYHKVWYDFSSQFYFQFGDGRGNNLFAPYGSGHPFINLTETIETPLILDAWRSLYIVVTQSDYAILNLDRSLEHGVTEEQVNQLKGEARFMRGLAYWYLGSAWGNVPIVENPLELGENFIVKPNPFEDVLQFAIRDMEFAAEWLPETDVPGRVTKYSAKGMLARMYVTAACYARGNKFSGRWTTTAAEYYDMARLAAKEVIEESSYALLDGEGGYENLFRVQYNNNSESLFALQFVPGESEYGVGNRNQDWLAYSTDVTNGLTAWGNTFASGDLVQLMHERGEVIRKKAAFFYPGAVYDYLGGHTEQGYWEIFHENDPSIPQEAGNSAIRYPLVKKHVVGGPDDTDGYAMNGNLGLATPMLRLAEVYLLYSEAILGMDEATSDGEALFYFNEVRKRAGMDEVTSITLADIWDERRVELALEGQFWFDMVRRAYWDQDWVLNYMGNQHRNEYYFYLHPNEAPDGFVWRDITPGHEMNPPSADRLLIPYPSVELTLIPTLRDEPVPFDFGE